MFDMNSIPLSAYIGGAVGVLAFGFAVNAAILAATAQVTTQGPPPGEGAQAGGAEDETDLSLDDIFALVEASEAAEVEERIASACRDQYAPASYQQVLEDAAEAVRAGVADGQLLQEVQLPALPSGQQGLGEIDSDRQQEANVELARALGALLAQRGSLATGFPWRTHILVPDRVEYDRARALLQAAPSAVPGGDSPLVTIGTLAEVDRSLAAILDQTISGADYRESMRDAMAADVLLAVNCSAVELLSVEAYRNQLLTLDDDSSVRLKMSNTYVSAADLEAESEARPRPLIIFNCELDSLRGDLGLPGFPPQELQHRFLSRVLPVFMVRKRSYNKTLFGGGGGPSPAQDSSPSIVRQMYYSGALFREYPGPWQVMYKDPAAGGALVSVRTARDRFKLREVKQALKDASGLAEEAGSVDEFLRGEAGVWATLKAGTWWEQEDALALDQSSNWRR